MRLTQLALFTVLLLAMLVTAPTVHAQSDLPSQLELERHGLTMPWWNRAKINPALDRIRHFSADESIVFVQTTSGIVTAIDSETGKMLWGRMIGAPNQITFPVVTNDKLAFITAGMKLFAVNKLTGSAIWQIALSQHPSTAPEVDEDRIYLGMVDGSVFAYNLHEINRLYNERMLPEYSDLARLWRYQAPSSISAAPVSNGESVAFASQSGMLFSVSAIDRGLNYLYETQAGAQIRNSVGRSGNTLFIASDDSRVTALDLTNGATRWFFTAPSAVREQPRVVGSNVFVMPARRGLYCLKTSSGYEQWLQPKAKEFIAASIDSVYTTDGTGNFLILNRETGAINARLPLRKFTNFVQNERTDRIFLSTADGLVICIREIDRRFPIWHMFPERQPIRPIITPDDPATEAADDASN